MSKIKKGQWWIIEIEIFWTPGIDRQRQSSTKEDRGRVVQRWTEVEYREEVEAE